MMKSFCPLFLLVAVSATSSSASWSFQSRKGCVLDVNLNFHQNAPVLLRRGSYGYELAAPNDVISVGNYFLGYHRTGVIKIPYEGNLYAACPGYGNTLFGLKEPAQFATYNCFHRKKKLRMDKQMFKSHLVRCTQPVTTLIRETERLCGQGLGREYEIGYTITPESNPSARNPHKCGLIWTRKYQPDSKRAHLEGESHFYRLFSCCYDPEGVRSLYSQNVLQGSKIAGAETRRSTPSYILGQSSLYPPAFDVHSSYEYPNQMKVLAGVLGRAKAEPLLARTSLVRAHLASELDFLMGNWQASSNAYINLIPQWQSINRGNWQQIEKKIRCLADNTQSSLIITTGTYGVMTTVDDYNTTKKLYLDPDRKLLPVPDILWKVVFSPRNSSCIAFVMSNNPLEETPPPPLCQDVCKDHGWPEDYTSPLSGRLYCCTVEALRAAISYVPQFRCVEVLDYVSEEIPRTVPAHRWFRRKS